MKILLVMNKTLWRTTPDGNISVPRIDLGFWNVYVPLMSLGHEVILYDTINPVDADFDGILESFKPDLIWCCMTGNRSLAPFEPWDSVARETETGRTKTFNWFCDDTWRFDKWSSKACQAFNVCSTPEPGYIEKYKEAGYDNIILGAWHASTEICPIPPQGVQKSIPISFCGAPNVHRQQMMFHLRENGIDPVYFYGCSTEDMMLTHGASLVGLNFSRNMTDGGTAKTQMKARMFEIPAAMTMLLTEYTKDLEQFFDIGTEIVCFHDSVSLLEKAKYYISNPEEANKIAVAGHRRLLKEHESRVRLANVLKQIEEL